MVVNTTTYIDFNFFFMYLVRMDYIPHLLNLGLTLNEAKIYESLIRLKTGSIDSISKEADIHRRNVYDTLERLQQKGLVYQVVSSKTLLFEPVDPEKLSESVEEKQRSLNLVLPALSALYKRQTQEHTAAIYKGVGGLKSFIRLILEENKTIYGIGSKGTWFDPRISKFMEVAKKKYDKQKMRSHLIFDFDMKGHPEVLEIIGKPHKFLPEKYSTGSSMDIFGEYIAIYSGVNVKALDKDITIFLLKNQTMAEDYKKWFQLLWDLLPEEK